MGRLIERAAGVAMLALGGCAATVPHELADARVAYERAATSPGAGLAPAELQSAGVALSQAEAAYASDPDANSTRDLAYVAGRRARVAEAAALAESDRRRRAQAEAYSSRAQAEMTQRVRGQLGRTREELATERARADQERALSAAERARLESERALVREQLGKTEAQLGETEQARRDAERARADAELARVAAEQRTAKAMSDLSRLEAARREARGTVITIPSGVLFATGEWTILPGAQAQLDQIASAARNLPRSIVIEGHTDSRGSTRLNQELSLRRAQAVCGHLVEKGVLAERCMAVGLGASRPLASNRTAEGRATNRRVEIVVPPAPGPSEAPEPTRDVD